MEDAHKSEIKKEKNGRGLLLLAAGILLGLCCIGLLFLFLNYPEIIRPGTPPQRSFTEKPIITATLLQESPAASPVPIITDTDNSCATQTAKYAQLLHLSYASEGISGGTFHGILRKIYVAPQTNIAMIKMTSFTGTDVYTFYIDTRIVFLYNKISHKAYTSITQLPAGKATDVSYNCDPKTGNIFTIVSILINS